MSERWGKVHFGLTFFLVNATFLVMYQLGMAGMPRRYADPSQCDFLAHVLPLNQAMAAGAVGLGLVQLFLLVNVTHSLFSGKRVSENPWKANTLEWSTSSPPPCDNYLTQPTVYRGPHEYSSPETNLDFLPQWVAPEAITDFEDETAATGLDDEELLSDATGANDSTVGEPGEYEPGTKEQEASEQPASRKRKRSRRRRKRRK